MQEQNYLKTLIKLNSKKKGTLCFSSFELSCIYQWSHVEIKKLQFKLDVCPFVCLPQ